MDNDHDGKDTDCVQKSPLLSCSRDHHVNHLWCYHHQHSTSWWTMICQFIIVSLIFDYWFYNHRSTIVINFIPSSNLSNVLCRCWELYSNSQAHCQGESGCHHRYHLHQCIKHSVPLHCHKKSSSKLGDVIGKVILEEVPRLLAVHRVHGHLANAKKTKLNKSVDLGNQQPGWQSPPHPSGTWAPFREQCSSFQCWAPMPKRACRKTTFLRPRLFFCKIFESTWPGHVERRWKLQSSCDLQGSSTRPGRQPPLCGSPSKTDSSSLFLRFCGFTLARVVPSPWSGNSSPGVLEPHANFFLQIIHFFPHWPEHRAHGLWEQFNPLIKRGRPRKQHNHENLVKRRKPRSRGRVFEAVCPQTVGLLLGWEGEVCRAGHLLGFSSISKYQPGWFLASSKAVAVLNRRGSRGRIQRLMADIFSAIPKKKFTLWRILGSVQCTVQSTNLLHRNLKASHIVTWFATVSWFCRSNDWTDHGAAFQLIHGMTHFFINVILHALILCYNINCETNQNDEKKVNWIAECQPIEVLQPIAVL